MYIRYILVSFKNVKIHSVHKNYLPERKTLPFAAPKIDIATNKGIIQANCGTTSSAQVCIPKTTLTIILKYATLSHH